MLEVVQKFITKPKNIKLFLKTIGKDKIDDFGNSIADFILKQPLNRDSGEVSAAIQLAINEFYEIEFFIAAFDLNGTFLRKIPQPFMQGKDSIPYRELPEFLVSLLNKAEK